MIANKLLIVAALWSGTYSPKAMAAQAAPTLRESTDISELARELPGGSDLLQRLQAGQRGDKVEKPYMIEMQHENIRRAFFEINGTWRSGSLESPRVVRRLYFSKYDGSYAQIIDTARLAQIKASGLEELLDRTALERAKSVGLFALHGLTGSSSPVYGFQEFFDNALLPELRTPMSQFKSYEARMPFKRLIGAASIGDAIAVLDLTRHSRFSQKELNGALFQAVRHDYDNTAVIEALLKAGANINAPGYEGKTPLMMPFRCLEPRLVWERMRFIEPLSKMEWNGIELPVLLSSCQWFTVV